MDYSYGKVSIPVELDKLRQAVKRGENPCKVCQGFLMSTCVDYALAGCQQAELKKPSRPKARRKTGRQREIDWLEGLYRLSDPRV